MTFDVAPTNPGENFMHRLVDFLFFVFKYNISFYKYAWDTFLNSIFHIHIYKIITISIIRFNDIIELSINGYFDLFILSIWFIDNSNYKKYGLSYANARWFFVLVEVLVEKLSCYACVFR